MFPVFLIQIVVALIIVGLVLWVVSQIPMDATIARIIRVVVIVAVCIWLISLLVPLLGVGTPLIRR
jgi:low temperature requirement protein LtrA